MTDNEQKPSNGTDNAQTKMVEEPLVESPHELSVNGRTLRYTTTTGRMPLKNAEGEIEAQVFFMAYTLDRPGGIAQRPLTFVFNGGPGSSSIWLHLGGLAPRRVRMEDEGWMPAPPYKLVENEHTWLEFTDLVFIDPVGTGYSRAASEELSKKFWNMENDIESVGEFIRLYLTRSKRWASPLFLAGESYGTTRAAGLAGHLVNKGIAFNGIILISTILNFQTARFTRGNDLPYSLFLPTYTASAWYHNRLPEDLQKKPLRDVLAEVEDWVETGYSVALMRGDKLTAEERDEVVAKLVRYTGLSERHVDHSNLRIHIMRFCKELLRDDEKRTVGRLDSRFKGIDASAVTEFPDFDPSMRAITPPYTAMLYDYVRSELGYESDLDYEVLSGDVNQAWEWPKGQYPDTSEALRSALAKNPFLKVMVAIGYYDLATPYFAVDYTLNHMDIDPALRNNIHVFDYEAGHMVYLDVTSLAKLKADTENFVKFSVSG